MMTITINEAMYIAKAIMKGAQFNVEGTHNVFINGSDNIVYIEIGEIKIRMKVYDFKMTTKALTLVGSMGEFTIGIDSQ